MALKNSISCGGVRCHTRRCKACHNARRALRKWFQDSKKTDEWENMGPEDRREMVKQNKNKGSGKGYRRPVLVKEQATCSDKLKLENLRPFLTQKQFL